MSAQASSGFKHEIWQLINLDHSLIACGGFKKKTFLCELSAHESVRLILLHQLKHCSGKLPHAGSAHATLQWPARAAAVPSISGPVSVSLCSPTNPVCFTPPQLCSDLELQSSSFAVFPRTIPGMPLPRTGPRHAACCERCAERWYCPEAWRESGKQ